MDRLTLPQPPVRVHFVGIGGIGMSGLARILQSTGYQVSGSDLQATPLTADLAVAGIDISIGHEPGHVRGVSLVVISAAVRSTNPEVKAAREADIPVIKRAALLGLLSRYTTTLAVAGSHGKSTTSGMATVALEQAGYAPSFAVGATIEQLGTNARAGSGRYFVLEADEYDHSFLWLEPAVAIITNIEHDHPDIFPTFDDVLQAFERFVHKIRPGGTLVIRGDDPGCQQLLARLGSELDISIVTFGTAAADWRIADRVRVVGPGERTFELWLAVPGRHNQMNALAVLGSAGPLGLSVESILTGLEEYQGVGRRFEVLRDDHELVVIHDYAHHPTEIAVMIEATRHRHPGRRLVVVFQPHTFSRTKAFLQDFARSLDAGDEIILADIYPAREADTFGVSSESILEHMRSNARAAGDLEQTFQAVSNGAQSGDVVLILGAGDIVNIADRLARIL